MEQLRILSDNGKTTKYIVNDLLESAIKFYGKQYKDIILEAVRDTFFYECDADTTDEMLDTAIDQIEGTFKSQLNKHMAFNFFCMENGNRKNCVVWFPKGNDVDYHIIAHELFGHGVCDRRNYIINDQYYRNGIELTSVDGNSQLTFINEGIMEYIAVGITKNKKDIKDVLLNCYEVDYEIASLLFKVEGKEKMLDFLINYESNLESVNLRDLKKLDKKLGEYHNNMLTYAPKDELCKQVEKIKKKSFLY